VVAGDSPAKVLKSKSKSKAAVGSPATTQFR
jgi:hypothetical protein